MPRRIAVTFDYRCPFARNAHEAIVSSIRAGSPIEWSFQAFSLDQSSSDPDRPPVWERPPAERGSGVLPLEWGIAVRDTFAEHFLAVHLALFAIRFDAGRQQDEPNVRAAIAACGLDPDAVAAEVATGRPLATLAAEHTAALPLDVFGVPTFVEDGVATFVRFMERNRVDDLDRVVDLLDCTRINEFKRTQVPY
jgi:DSBA-like thioredoxin domain